MGGVQAAQQRGQPQRGVFRIMFRSDMCDLARFPEASSRPVCQPGAGGHRAGPGLTKQSDKIAMRINRIITRVTVSMTNSGSASPALRSALRCPPSSTPGPPRRQPPCLRR